MRALVSVEGLAQVRDVVVGPFQRIIIRSEAGHEIVVGDLQFLNRLSRACHGEQRGQR